MEDFRAIFIDRKVDNDDYLQLRRSPFNHLLPPLLAILPLPSTQSPLSPHSIPRLNFCLLSAYQLQQLLITIDLLIQKLVGWLAFCRDHWYFKPVVIFEQGRAGRRHLHECRFYLIGKVLLVVLCFKVLRLYWHFKIACFLVNNERACGVGSSRFARLPFFHFPAVRLVFEEALEGLSLTLEFLVLLGLAFLGRWAVHCTVGRFGLLDQFGDALGDLLDKFPYIF